MGKKTPPRIRRAATMFVAGYDTHAILKEVGIRYTTLLRWEQTPLYKESLLRAERQLEYGMATRLRRLVDDCLSDTEDAMQQDRDVLSVDDKKIDIVIDIVKAVGKQILFPKTVASKRAKEGPSGFEKGPNYPQKRPKKPQITPEIPQTALEMTAVAPPPSPDAVIPCPSA